MTRKSFVRNTRSALAILFLMLALVVAGCGEDDGENGDAGGGEHGAAGEGSGEGVMAGPQDDTPFVSSGVMHGGFDGVHEALTLEYDETFAGLLGDTEIAATFDEDEGMFLARVRNEASEAVCNVGIGLVLDPGTADERVVGGASPGSPLQIDGLTVRGRHSFTVPVSAMSFTQWTVEIETFACASAPAGPASGEGSEGGEGSGGEHGGAGEGSEGAEHGVGGEHGAGGEHGGGGEGSGEHGAGGEGSGEDSEGGGESGEEANPSIPVTERYTNAGENADQTFDFHYEMDTGLFRGTVENTSGARVCASRTEIHLGTATGVIELGPTIREDLEPGDVLYVVLYWTGMPETYILHPEASACP